MTHRFHAIAALAMIALMLGGCDAIAPQATPTPAPTAEATPSPTPTPEYLEGGMAEPTPDDVTTTTVPDWFPTDALPLLPDHRGIFVDDQSDYTSITYITDSDEETARAFYRDNAAAWSDVGELTGEGAWTIQGQAGGRMLAATVTQYADEPTSVSVTAYYKRDMQEGAGSGSDAGTRAPEDTPKDTPEPETTPEPDATPDAGSSAP